MTLGIVRFIVGLLILPLCVAMTQAVISLVRALPVPADTLILPPSLWALAGGLVLWLVLYFSLPRPILSYVLAHELTHALWGSLMGEKVLGMSVSDKRGSVTLSDSNFLITLAPYFFPLYTILVIAGYYVAGAFFDVEAYHLCWLALVGFTWGFHCTFTVSSLLQHQSDIKECGHLFSYTVIYFFNMLGIGLWVVAVSSATLEQLVRFMAADTAALGILLWKWVGLAAGKTVQYFEG